MFTRRALTTAAVAFPLAACVPQDAYAQAVANTWRLFPPAPGFPVQALVHAATLAANGHNTQAWRFAASGARIRIAPDLSRRTPVVDPDDHHMFVGLGCAAETMLQAAPTYGWRGEVETVIPTDGVVLAFAPGPVATGPMSAAIPLRASTRSVYDGRAVPAAVLGRLAQVAGDRVGLTLITDRPRFDQASDFILRGNAAQVQDPAFRRELEAWIRFNPGEALSRRDGLFAPGAGNPTLPRFVGERLFGLVFTERGEAGRISRQMQSSAGLAVFTGPAARAEAWVEVGRAFTRFALAATAAGMKLAFLNQPVEDVATRGDFARWLGLGASRPDLVVRFGYGPALPRSLRRPVAQVLQAW